MKSLLRCLLSLIFIILTACQASRPAPVAEIKPYAPVIRGSHVVEAGDTLSSIAYRYGRDTSELASINGLKYPFTITKGQKISLDSNSKPQISTAKKSQHKNKHKPKSQVVHQVKNKTKVNQTTKNAWSWPTPGKIITRFQENPGLNKGIDIKNNKGTPVKAALPGKVVYSGEGLRGYGRLLILKHDDDYLSAYAHNDELLVKEGQYVNQGQTIATMGKSDTDQVKLHFEIRYRGKPIDPLRILPADHS